MWYAMEPRGEEREDVHAAIVAATVANVNRGKRRTVPITDFMPFREKSKREASSDLSRQLRAAFVLAAEQKKKPTPI